MSRQRVAEDRLTLQVPSEMLSSPDPALAIHRALQLIERNLAPGDAAILRQVLAEPLAKAERDERILREWKQRDYLRGHGRAESVAREVGCDRSTVYRVISSQRVRHRRVIT